MFILFLASTFLIALAVSYLLVRVFRPAVTRILQRILTDDIHREWVRYLVFAIYVVGISSGVRIWDLEKYISPTVAGDQTREALALTVDRTVLEIYRTEIGTLQGVAWMLLVFFVIALIAFVVVRIGEVRQQTRGE